MMSGTPLTVEFVMVVAGAVTVAIGALIWVIREIRSSGHAVAEDIKELRGELRGIKEDVSAHKLKVSEDYVSKETFNLVTHRIADDIRAARDELVSRLIRIEDRIPSWQPRRRPPGSELG